MIGHIKSLVPRQLPICSNQRYSLQSSVSSFRVFLILPHFAHLAHFLSAFESALTGLDPESFITNQPDGQSSDQARSPVSNLATSLAEIIGFN